MKHPVRIVGFMPTPFTDEDQVDIGQLRELAARLAGGGVHPAILGGMGEYYALNRGESRDCMAAAVDGAAGIPVVAGVGWATREAIAIASDASDLGIDTIVINPPHYASPSPRAYAEHVRQVADAAGVGAVVYSAAHFAMTDLYLDELVKVEGFRGVKEEHFGATETADRISRWGDRIEWWGVGEVSGSEYARVGADVVTTSLANLRADLAVRAITAFVTGRPDDEAELAARSWCTLLSADEDGAPAFLTEVMHQTAGWNRTVRHPLLPSAPSSQASVREFISAWADAESGTMALGGIR